MDRASLPDLNWLDCEALLALFRKQQEQQRKLDAMLAAQDEQLRRLEGELEAHRQTLSEQADELHSRSERIEHLKLMIEKLRHMIFGTKSEKIVIQLEQMELELEDEETTQAEAEAAVERLKPAEEPKARPERKPLPEHLPREVMRHAPNRDCCPDCGGQLRQFGEDVAEQLEYIPDSFKVIRHVRPKFACSGCDRVVEAPAPSRPIERGLAAPGLLAHVIVSKFADHLPLYRQSEIYARQGVEIPRSTLAGWVGAASDLLGPLVDAIQKHVLAGRKLHADDTPMPVLSPGNGKTKTGRMWTYVRDDRPAGEPTAPAVWFTYSEDRKGEHPRQHLKNFKGALQADAYAGFHHLYGEHLYEAACWAHARRKFHEIHVIHASPTTAEALARIGALYAIEEEIRGKPADIRLNTRQSRATPLLDELRTWMEKALRSLSSKSETAGANRYALSRWRALIRYDRRQYAGDR
jgi:transposase